MSSREREHRTIPEGDSDFLGKLRTYYQVRTFYDEEARRLDDREFESWLDLLTEDITYRIPVRTTTAEGGESEFLDLCYIDDNRWRLEKRIERLRTEHAWSERPHTRTRHFVSNVRISDDRSDELGVDSNLLVFINRGTSPDYRILSGERRDVLRRRSDGVQLAARTVYLDQSTLPLDKLSVLL